MPDEETRADHRHEQDQDDVRIVIRYNMKTRALRFEGPIPQPVIFYGILEAAKDGMRWMMQQTAIEQQADAQIREQIMGGRGKPLPPEFQRR
jgi:hypothetical protein